MQIGLPFIIRKFLHIITGGIFLLFIKTSEHIFLPLTIFIFVTVAIDIARKYIPRLNEKFILVFSPLLKPDEKNGQLSGATTLWLSLYLIWILFPENIFFIAGMITVFADPLCALVGRFSGKTAFYRSKTVIGSLTFFILSFLILCRIGNLPVLDSMVLSLIFMILELFSPAVLENFTVAVGSAIFLNIYFSILK